MRNRQKFGFSENGTYVSVVIAASLMMAGSLGLNMNTAGVFILPLVESMEIAVASVSFHVTLITLGGALGGFIVPGLIRRFDFRQVLLIATLITVAMTYLMGQTNDIYWFYVFSFVRGIVTSFFNVIAVQELINRWFIKHHGVITSLVLSFSGVAGAVLSPLLTQVVAHYGIEVGYTVQALLFLLLNLPGILLPYSLDPRDRGMRIYGEESASEVVKTEVAPTALNLSQRKTVNWNIVHLLVFSFIGTALTGLYQHLNSMGNEFGMNPAQASLLVSLCMIGNIVFKLIIGWLSDMKNPIFASVSMLGLTLIGLFIFWTDANFSLLYFGSLIFGAVFSISNVGRNLLAVNSLPADTFTRVFPTINFVASIGGAIMISVYGALYDYAQSYQLAIIVSIVMTIIGVISTVLIKLHPLKTNK
ncbi:MFS transporter [Fundicoccus sp. Sow4_H7]|uniref:MFS transporter n=1 Tax=Fundicoccus sp. Sow4_H7 TaxID=3438784 RepID=UPI003F8E7099